jgi:hypothetical protein
LGASNFFFFFTIFHVTSDFNICIISLRGSTTYLDLKLEINAI